MLSKHSGHSRQFLGLHDFRNFLHSILVYSLMEETLIQLHFLVKVHNRDVRLLRLGRLPLLALSVALQLEDFLREEELLKRLVALIDVRLECPLLLEQLQPRFLLVLVLDDELPVDPVLIEDLSTLLDFLPLSMLDVVLEVASEGVLEQGNHVASSVHLALAELTVEVRAVEEEVVAVAIEKILFPVPEVVLPVFKEHPAKAFFPALGKVSNVPSQFGNNYSLALGNVVFSLAFVNVSIRKHNFFDVLR